MRDAGGHGGSSHAETNVPLIVVGQKCAEKIKESYKQIDIAPTVAVLSALPIPASSIGALIPELLIDLTMEQQLYAFHYNAKRLMDKLILVDGTDQIGNTEIYKQFTEAKIQHEAFILSTDAKLNAVNVAAFKRAKMLYVSASKAMSEQLAKSHLNDDSSINHLDCTYIGLAVIFIVSVIFIDHYIISSCIHIFIFFSQSFQSLLNIFLSQSSPMHKKTIPLKWLAAVAVITFGGHLALIGDINYYIQSLMFTAICSLISFIIMLFVQNVHISSIEQQFFRVAFTCPPLCRFFVFGIIFHSISYGSSSFIEEEHQTWYYLTNTAFIALYLLETRSSLQPTKDGKIKNKSSLRRRQLQWFCLFAAHLIARRLNQTGDKWLMQPDIGDWLTMDEHRLWNSLFVFASLCCLFVNCVDFGSILTNVLTLTACTLIYYFRTIGGFVYFGDIKKSE